MFAYPTTFPLDEASTLLGLLKGGTLNTALDVHAAWAVASYGLGQAVPMTAAMNEDGAVPPVTNNKQAAECLGRLVAAEKDPSMRQGMGGVPWQSIVSVILTLIQSWLSQQK